MELRHLKSFAAAAEAKSFTRAASALALTQAAVSQHIAALERELGVSLFRRGAKSVTPTPAGRRLYRYARQVLDLLQEARNELRRGDLSVRGALSIATCTIPPESILPPLLRQFRQRYPEVSATVAVSDSVGAAQAVQSGTADLGMIIQLPPQTPLRATAIACVEMVLVVSPRHPLAGAEGLTLEQLATASFVVREPGSGSRQCFDEAFARVGISPKALSIAMEMNSNEAIRATIQQGTFVAFLSRTAAQREIADGRLVRLFVENLQVRRHLFLVTDPARFATPAARAFIELIAPQHDRAGVEIPETVAALAANS